MILNTKILAIAIPAVLFTGIGLSMLTDLWDTGADRQPSRYQDDALNPYDPQSISGSYSLLDISAFFDIPLDTLYEAFGISETFDPGIFKAKNLSSIYEPTENEIGTQALQAFVALYNGLTYALVDVYLPESAIASILAHNPDLPGDQLAYLDAHAIKVVLVDLDSVSFSEAEDETSAVFTIKGPTTIQEVLDAGLSLEAFEAIVKVEVAFTNQTVKDFCIDKGLSYSEIKEALQAALSQ